MYNLNDCWPLLTSAGTFRTRCDTIKGGMRMEDYKVRFIAEYNSLRERLGKLSDMLAKHYAGALHFKPTCPIALLERQRDAMRDYLQVLEERAVLENIGL